MIFRAALWSSLALCAAALPALAAPKTVSEIANYAGADRQQILEDGARREGALMLYATGTQIQPLLDRFMQKYPFIKVAMPRASSIDVTRKVIEEYGAGLYQVDAYELSSYGLVVPRAEGLLQPFSSPELADYDQSTIEPGPQLGQRARELSRHRLQYPEDQRRRMRPSPIRTSSTRSGRARWRSPGRCPPRPTGSAPW